MAIQQESMLTESDILSDVLMTSRGDLSAEVAQSVLRWKFGRRSTSRINKLAERNQDGTISTGEREELERFLRVGGLLNRLHAKVRLCLQSTEET